MLHMGSKADIQKRIEQEKVELAHVESYAPTKYKFSDFAQIFLVFVAIFSVIFVFKVGKTLLVEADSNSNYVTYRECVDSDSEYSNFGERSTCIEYKSHRIPLANRIGQHFTGSLLIPSILLVIYVLYGLEARHTSSSNIKRRKSNLVDLYGELEKSQ